MQEISKVKFPRSLTPQDVQGKPILCIFSDASEDAFGTCAYLRWIANEGNYDVRFVTAKSRVAPLHKLTVPRLELQAAVMAVRLYKILSAEMRLNVEKTVFMTDSMITLGWIRSSSRQFKPFVANRIGEIQANSDPQNWRHVPGTMNPADYVSRGVSPQDILARWSTGPDFLY